MKKYRWWALAVVTFLALTLLSTTQTGAFWRDETATTGATIRSGELKILAGPTGGVGNYLWNDFGGQNLSPGSVVQKPLTISVAGSTTSNLKAVYRLQSMVVSSADVPLTFSAWIVGGAADCPASGNPGNILGGPWTSFPAPTVARSLAIGASEVWCMRATVGATAQPNKKTTVTLGFRADQTP